MFRNFLPARRREHSCNPVIAIRVLACNTEDIAMSRVRLGIRIKSKTTPWLSQGMTGFSSIGVRVDNSSPVRAKVNDIKTSSLGPHWAV